MSERLEPIVIDAPATGADETARRRTESQTVARDPAFRGMIEAGRKERAEGRAIPAAELYAELGYTPPDATHPTATRRPRTSGKDRYSGRLLVRLPASVHRQLAEQAKMEGTTVDRLVLNYVSRGLGLAGVEA